MLEFRRGILGPAIAIVVMGSFLQAQTNDGKDKSDPSKAPQNTKEPQAKETLFVLVKTDGKKLPQDLKKDFELAVQAAKATTSGIGTPKPIPPLFYYQLDSVIRNADIELNTKNNNPGGMEFRRMPVVEPKWEFKLPNPSEQLLKTMVVKYAKAGEITYIAKSSDPTKEKQFELIERGRYGIAQISDDVPESFKATLIQLGSKKEIIVEGAWPETVALYMVAIRDFVGDKALMYNQLKDSKVIPDPAKDIQQENFTFSFLNMTNVSPTDIPVVANGKYIATVAKSPEISPKRVWILFPLTKQQAEEQEKLLNDPKIERETVAKTIRSQGVVPVTEDAVADLDSQKPKWIELGEQGLGQPFRRDISLGDDLGKFMKNYPEVYQLVVREFDNGLGTIAAIKVDGKHANLQHLKTLSTAIKKMESEPKKP